MRYLTLLTTGGTIEKTYDELTGKLENRRSIVGRMLRRIRLEDTAVSVVELLRKDSLDMTDADRAAIADAVRHHLGPALSPPADALVVLHGTDTLCTTGDHLARVLGTPRVPVVLVGAMRPYEMQRSDALQNLTEAIFATSLLAPGVYVVAHGRALRFPGVHKDRARGTFVADRRGPA